VTTRANVKRHPFITAAILLVVVAGVGMTSLANHTTSHPTAAPPTGGTLGCNVVRPLIVKAIKDLNAEIATIGKGTPATTKETNTLQGDSNNIDFVLTKDPISQGMWVALVPVADNLDQYIQGTPDLAPPGSVASYTGVLQGGSGFYSYCDS
jgi:hypothetical protein